MATELPAVSPVLDEEALLRAVRDDSIYFSCASDGSISYLSITAFNDRDSQPSVDRLTLRAGGAGEARKSATDGVLVVHAHAVRAIKTVNTNDAKGKLLQAHMVDVEHDPLPENHSHALVKAAPILSSGTAFKKLKEALSRIAQANGWAFRPGSIRD